jgi:GH24 family phage-related lysozyme (muramidase)
MSMKEGEFMMNISQAGIDLIKKFEGCRLKAYKAVKTEIYFTIGYGHYGSDVKEGQVITQAEANRLLETDLRKFVLGVNALLKVPVNQNQFDALVSFAFNCGVGALQKSTLLKYINITDFISASNEFDEWVHAGGKVLNGLVNRRAAEKALFLKAVTQPPKSTSSKDVVPYPGHLIKKGSKGKDVERIQRAVGADPDGIYGPKTEAAVKAYQKRHGLAVDGIVGPITWSMMF